MRRTAALVITGFVALGLTACSGGEEGDADAFCDDLEELAEQIRDRDFDNRDGLQDIRATVNALLEDAPSGAPLEAVQAVRDAIREENQRGEELLETMVDELEDHAEDCDIDDFGEVEDPVIDTTTSSTTSSSTTSSTSTSDTVGGGAALEPEDVVIGGRDPVPAGIDPQFADLAQNCFNGLARACDDLFLQTPFNSVEEAYGLTCGGRITEAEGAEVNCVELLFAAVAPPVGITDTANAQACFEGSMVACDDLFNGAAPNTPDRAYGFDCGGRVLNTNAFCVDIFGEVSVVG